MVPRPVRVYTRFPEQMHERLLAFLHSDESVVRDDRVVRQVGARREYTRRGEGERTRVVAHGSILTVELHLRLRTGRE